MYGKQLAVDLVFNQTRERLNRPETFYIFIFEIFILLQNYNPVFSTKNKLIG